MTVRGDFYLTAVPLVLVFLFLSFPVGLQAQNSRHDSDIQEMIVTAFRVEQDRETVAGSIDALDQTSLNLISHLHIQESLNRLPGISFHRNDGQEYLAAIRSPVLTGAGSCGSVMTMEDGLPLRPIGFCNVNELFEAHTEQANSIEVIRGPGAAVFGSKAMHGVVNVIDVVSLEQSVNAGIEIGAYGFGRVQVSGGNKSWGASFTGATESGYRDESGNDQQKLSLRHVVESNEVTFDTQFTATNLNQETAGFLEGEDAYRDENLARTNPNPEAFRDTQALRFSTKISDQAASWQIRPYLRYSDMTFLQHFLPGQPLEENGHHSLGILSQFRFDIDTSAELITGIDFEYADSWLKQSQENPTEGSDFLQETIPQGQHYNYEVQSFVIGPYAHLDWSLSDQLKLGIGARLEQVDYRYHNLMINGRTRDDGTECGFGGCRYSRPPDSTDSFHNFSPKLSISYDLSPDAMFYLNYSSGFRAPEITELYRLQRNQTVAELDSEELNSIEFGGRLNVGTVRYEFALFDMKKDNVIFRDVDFFNVSNGKTDHKGIEAKINWQVSDQLNWSTAASYAEHTYANNPGLSAADIINNDIDTAPRRFGSSQMAYELGQAVIELEWQHMGSYYTDPENEHHYDGHNLLHLRAYLSAGQNWRFSLRLNNLTDERYAERADFSSFSGDRYFPGLPRRVYLGVEFQLD